MIRKTGFTLIELLVVISIIAVMIALVMPNLLGARGRARDSARKTELRELKLALRLYYNDYQDYPTDANGDFLFDGCGNDGKQECSLGTGCEFAAGATACDDPNLTLYMKRLPRKPGDIANTLGFEYYKGVDDFCLTTELENAGDKDIGISQTRCGIVCGANCSGKEYCMCAD